MKTRMMPTNTLRHLFFSLKDQYENNRPMTDGEERNMFDIAGELWLRNKGKFKLGLKIQKK